MNQMTPDSNSDSKFHHERWLPSFIFLSFTIPTNSNFYQGRSIRLHYTFKWIARQSAVGNWTSAGSIIKLNVFWLLKSVVRTVTERAVLELAAALSLSFHQCKSVLEICWSTARFSLSVTIFSVGSSFCFSSLSCVLVLTFLCTSL